MLMCTWYSFSPLKNARSVRGKESIRCSRHSSQAQQCCSLVHLPHRNSRFESLRRVPNAAAPPASHQRQLRRPRGRIEHASCIQEHVRRQRVKKAAARAILSGSRTPSSMSCTCVPFRIPTPTASATFPACSRARLPARPGVTCLWLLPFFPRAARRRLRHRNYVDVNPATARSTTSSSSSTPLTSGHAVLISWSSTTPRPAPMFPAPALPRRLY